MQASATWWIKGDGCDVVKGLGESVRLEWSGDVDLNDGKVLALYKQYRECLDFISKIGLKERRAMTTLQQDLVAARTAVTADLAFISTGIPL